MTTLRAAAQTVALPLGGTAPWWGRPTAQLILVEIDQTLQLIGTLDAASVPASLAPAVAAALDLDPAAVLLVPSGARPGPALAQTAADWIATACASALVPALRPARLHRLRGHRWKLARLADAPASAWGARLERRSRELAGSRPDAALSRLVYDRNTQDAPPGLPWIEGLVDAGLRGFAVEDAETSVKIAVFAALRAALPAPARPKQPSSGALHHARGTVARRLWRKQRGAPPVVAIATGVSGDAVLRTGSDPETGRKWASDLARAIADAALRPDPIPAPPLSRGRTLVRPAGAPVREGAATLPEHPAVADARPRSLPGALGQPAPFDTEGWVHHVGLGDLQLLALPGQLTTGLANRVPQSTVLLGPAGGHLGPFCTAREHDRSTLGPLAGWGRESGRWLLEQAALPAHDTGAGAAGACLEPAAPTLAPAPVPVLGREPVLRMRRHTPASGAPTQLRIEVEWVGDAVETPGAWVVLERENGPLFWEGSPVDDLHQDMLIESRPHGETLRWRARWSLPVPPRWSSRAITASLPPWSLRSEQRRVP